VLISGAVEHVFEAVTEDGGLPPHCAKVAVEKTAINSNKMMFNLLFCINFVQ
jgi:hypothetical protein